MRGIRGWRLAEQATIPHFTRSSLHRCLQRVMRIATGEEEGTPPPESGKDPAAVSMGKRGGAARVAAMTPEGRAEISRKAAENRWRKAVDKWGSFSGMVAQALEQP